MSQSKLLMKSPFKPKVHAPESPNLISSQEKTRNSRKHCGNDSKNYTSREFTGANGIKESAFFSHQTLSSIN